VTIGGLDLNRPRAKLHVALALFVALVLPGGSLLLGDGVFAWTMFSKSATYRLSVDGVTAEGETRSFDPRALAPWVGPALAYFLPAPGTWRHDPVGLTFRTGLANVAMLACRLGPLRGTEVRLEERSDLDAKPRTSVARARCR
jgi:hypothetical protein